MKQLTKICWQLIAPPSTPDFAGYFLLRSSDCMMESGNGPFLKNQSGGPHQWCGGGTVVAQLTLNQNNRV